MAFRVVLPHDTQTDIDEFIERRCRHRASASAVIQAMRAECDKLAANPTLGAAPLGTPFERRRIHRFTIPIEAVIWTVEFLYAADPQSQTIVLAGFREVLKDL